MTTTERRRWRDNRSKARRLLLVHLPPTQRQLLIDHGACLRACAWLFMGEWRTLGAAYDYCDEVEWMSWLLHALHIDHQYPDCGTERADDALRRQIPRTVVDAALRRAARTYRKAA